jgi:actin-related protein
MKCTHCQHELPVTALFCGKCGTRVPGFDSEVKSPEANAQPSPSVAGTPPAGADEAANNATPTATPPAESNLMERSMAARAARLSAAVGGETEPSPGLATAQSIQAQQAAARIQSAKWEEQRQTLLQIQSTLVALAQAQTGLRVEVQERLKALTADVDQRLAQVNDTMQPSLRLEAQLHQLQQGVQQVGTELREWPKPPEMPQAMAWAAADRQHLDAQFQSQQQALSEHLQARLQTLDAQINGHFQSLDQQIQDLSRQVAATESSTPPPAEPPSPMPLTPAPTVPAEDVLAPLVTQLQALRDQVGELTRAAEVWTAPPTTAPETAAVAEAEAEPPAPQVDVLALFQALTQHLDTALAQHRQSLQDDWAALPAPVLECPAAAAPAAPTDQPLPIDLTELKQEFDRMDGTLVRLVTFQTEQSTQMTEWVQARLNDMSQSLEQQWRQQLQSQVEALTQSLAASQRVAMQNLIQTLSSEQQAVAQLLLQAIQEGGSTSKMQQLEPRLEKKLEALFAEPHSVEAAPAKPAADEPASSGEETPLWLWAVLGGFGVITLILGVLTTVNLMGH